MLSKNKIKLINSLSSNKHRQQEGLFIAEGTKLIEALIDAHSSIQSIFATDEWLMQHRETGHEVDVITPEEMKKISQLTTPSQVLALVKIPTPPDINKLPANQLMLGLDNIRDPGNMGTIIRLAQWFGIDTIICNHGTVDCYNSKVVQATMGAIANIQIIYTNLEEFIDNHQTEQWPVYGTFLEGNNIFTEALSPSGLIVLGNEGNGISAPIAERINKKLLIPDFASQQNRPESLNVSVAAAIVCAEFRRRQFK